MPTSFTAMPPVASGAPPKPRKPRQPGALKGKIRVADDFDVTPDWLIDAFEGKDSDLPWPERSEEHTSELQSLMRISYAVFCLKKKKYKKSSHVDQTNSLKTLT